MKIIHLFLKKYNTFILFIIKRYIKKNINFNIKKEKNLDNKIKSCSTCIMQFILSKNIGHQNYFDILYTSCTSAIAFNL